MLVNSWSSLISSIGTISAVLFALGLSVIPAIWNRLQKRHLANKRIHLSLKIISKAIKDYRFYNPTMYTFGDGIIHYTYDPKNLKL